MSQQVTFTDYLLCLEFYRKLNQSKFSALLEKVKPVAARNPSDLALLMEWLNQNGLAADVLKWMEKLPAELTTNPPPSIAIADAFVQAKNWSRLKRWTRSGSWGESEYLRLAYQASRPEQRPTPAATPLFRRRGVPGGEPRPIDPSAKLPSRASRRNGAFPPRQSNFGC